MEKVKAQTTLQSIGEGVISTDVDGAVTYLNPAAEKLTGWGFEEATRRFLGEVFRVRACEGGESLDYPVDSCTRLGELIRHEHLLTLVRRDGSEFMVQDVATPLYDSNGGIVGMVLVFHDVSKLHRVSERLAFLASHDDLTELFNRREFESQLADAIVSAGKNGREHALCYIDLDQFKVVNDTCGHHVGDELLKQLSARIAKKLSKEDVFARLGGDEFGIILKGYSLPVAEAVAGDIKDVVSSFRFVWQRHVFEVGASIGLVPIQNDQMTPSEILMTADSACYIAKDKGRNRVHIYRPKDKDVIRRTGDMQWLQRLNKSLESDELVLYSQLIVPAERKSRRSGFHEVLLRARDETGQLVLPGKFLPSAERYQLMLQIDKWVIRNVFQMLSQASSFRAGMPIDLAFSINLSAQSLNDEGFLNNVLDQFEETGIDPRLIMFEITESAVISHLPGAVHVIRMLRTLGCKFSLDDFGSGLSSFGYLNNLPVDFIKINGRFVRDITENAVNRTIVMAIADIAEVMGLKTIAEFVETGDILEETRKCGIDFVQGWGIAEPKPLRDVFSMPELYLVSG
jgi:diguanylate cyclase (GGDEF)-like protein/PAS domain S-box-containing protein